jgi:hypothetical protein
MSSSSSGEGGEEKPPSRNRWDAVFDFDETKDRKATAPRSPEEAVPAGDARTGEAMMPAGDPHAGEAAAVEVTTAVDESTERPRRQRPSLFDRVFGAADDRPDPEEVGTSVPRPATDVPEADPDKERPMPRRAERRKRRSVRATIIASLAVACVAGLVVGAVLIRRNDSEPTTSASGPTTAAPSDSEAAANGGACANGHWPSLTVGEPTALTSGSSGYFVWNDLAGWHVRFVDTGADPQRSRGTVTGAARMQAVKKVPDDTEGTVELVANTLTFDLAGGSDPAGFDLGVGCASESVRFDLQGTILPWPVEDIYVGREGRAVSNPLFVEREK